MGFVICMKQDHEQAQEDAKAILKTSTVKQVTECLAAKKDQNWLWVWKHGLIMRQTNVISNQILE